MRERAGGRGHEETGVPHVHIVWAFRGQCVWGYKEIFHEKVAFELELGKRWDLEIEWIHIS